MPRFPTLDLPLLSDEEERALGEVVLSGREAYDRRRGSVPPLPGEVEALDQAIEAGKAASRKLVEHNTRIVGHALKGFPNTGDPEDVRGAGYEALVSAAQTFDYTRGPFFAWALLVIRRRCYDALDQRTIRVPSTQLRDSARVREARRHLKVELGRDATDIEVAEHLGLTVKRLSDLNLMPRVVASMDAELPGQAGTGRSVTLQAFMGERLPETNPFDKVDAEAVLEGLLGALSAEERTVLAARFGLGDLPTRTLEALGKDLGMNREKVRRIEAKALAKLRHPTSPTGAQDLLEALAYS